MAVAKLSKRTLNAFRPTERPYIVYDSDLTGFGLRVMPSGVKTWIVEYRPGGGGRKVAKRRMKIDASTRITPEQARFRARDILSRVHLGEDPAGVRAASRQTPSVAAFSERFLEEACRPPRIKPRTRRLYTHNLRYWVIPRLGAAKLDAVTSADIARLHGKVGSTAPTSANNVLVTLSSMYHFATEVGVVPRGFNPVRNAAKRFRTNKMERFLTIEEIGRLADTLRSVEEHGLEWKLTPNIDAARAKHRAKPDQQKIEVSPFVTAAIRLLVFTGCRRSEILNLRWSEVNFERGMLDLADSKTGKKSIVLNAPALAILSGLPRVGLFVIAGADPNSPRPDITKQWYRIRELAGLDGSDGKPPFRLHDFRHSFASFGVGGGMGLPIVGKLLGHSQSSTTARYSHLDADPLRRASEAIGATIVGAMEKSGGGNVVSIKRPA
jgi:integrase